MPEFGKTKWHWLTKLPHMPEAEADDFQNFFVRRYSTQCEPNLGRISSEMRWRRSKQREQDLIRELSTHLEAEAAEQRERGVSPEEARYAAQRAFGNRALVKEEL